VFGLYNSQFLTQFVSTQKTLADQLPTPFIIMHKFNAHTTLWGSKTINDKGKKLPLPGRLCIFNDGTDAYCYKYKNWLYNHPGSGLFLLLVA